MTTYDEIYNDEPTPEELAEIDEWATKNDVRADW